MALDIDKIIFISFLAINLGVGLFYSKGVRSTSEYAIGNRDFTTPSIIATLVATCIGGGTFSIDLIESYRSGLYYIIPAISADLLGLLITGYILIPRMVSFLGALSVAEAMGNIYGNKVRLVTALCGTVMSIGYVAMQFKIAETVMQLFFGESQYSFYGTVLISLIVILYSALGGIKSVTFTDILQFFTFGVIIPFICIVIWNGSLDYPTQIFTVMSNNPLLDYRKVIDMNNPRFVSSITLMAVFVIPAINPAFFQRISMSSGVTQAKKSFIYSGIILALVYITVCWTAMILLISHPNLDPDNLLVYIIETYTYTGLKALTVIGIMAAIMSTADSYMNCATILLGNDIIKPLIIKSSIEQSKELLILRSVCFFIGGLALMLAYNSGSLLHLFLKMLGFYMPVVSVPLLLAILGFRSKAKVVLLGMLAGSIAIILCTLYFNLEAGEVIVGMLANLITFIIAHFVYGGGQKDPTKNVQVLKKIAHERGKKFSNVFELVTNFSLDKYSYFILPKSDYIYSFVGAMSIIVTLTTAHHINLKALQNDNFVLFDFIYQSTLIVSFIMLIYPLLDKYRSLTLDTYFYLIATSYTLIFIPLLLAIISEFGQLQILMLLINSMILIFITRWQLAAISIALMSYASIKFSEVFMQTYLENVTVNMQVKLKIVYISLLLGSIIIAFLKPKQEEQERVEERVEHLSDIIKDQNSQIFNLSTLKQTFLRNLQHETNTPITGVYSMSQALHDCYDKLSDLERKNAINTIVTSSERLISYANNLIDVSKITSSNFNLKTSKVNLSNLLEETIRKIKRLYIAKNTEEHREIETSIEPDVIITCDEYYVRKSFENILINAVQYCKKGRITISLTKEKTQDIVSFEVRDQGHGIPKEELLAIFDPFITSSKTTTPAGGRGMGLTLVKAVAQSHMGSITADSDGESYSLFTMQLPAKV